MGKTLAEKQKLIRIYIQRINRKSLKSTNMKFISFLCRSMAESRSARSSLALIGLAAGVCCTIQSADAALIAYESFNYTAGSDLAGQGGWTATLGTPTVTNTGSTYTDSKGNVLATAGNAANLTNDGARVGLGSTYGGASGGVYYLSFLAEISLNAATNYMYLSPTLDGSPVTDFGKINTADSVNWTLRHNTALPGYSAGVISDTAVTQLSLIVLRLDFTGATNAIFHMWINPDLDAEPALENADAAGSRNTVSFNQIRIQGSANATFDEIRFGTSYGDVTTVIPEPSSLVLGVLGCGFLLRRKRSVSKA